MIRPGTLAPDFWLADQFGRHYTLADLRARRHVLLLFYPADFTPT